MIYIYIYIYLIFFFVVVVVVVVAGVVTLRLNVISDSILQKNKNKYL
jgi:hypothetical protein